MNAHPSSRCIADRGTGSLVAEDGKTYMFRRSAVCGGWFHDLSEGATVTFRRGGASGKT